MNKKAVEMTMQVIVIAILALIVLVVLIFIFKEQVGNAARQFFKIGNSTDKCITDRNSPECNNFLGIGQTPTTPDKTPP